MKWKYQSQGANDEGGSELDFERGMKFDYVKMGGD